MITSETPCLILNAGFLASPRQAALKKKGRKFQNILDMRDLILKLRWPSLHDENKGYAPCMYASLSHTRQIEIVAIMFHGLPLKKLKVRLLGRLNSAC